MPIKMGDKEFKDIAEAVRHIRKTRPEIKDPFGYVASVERIVQERRAAKVDRQKKS